MGLCHPELITTPLTNADLILYVDCSGRKGLLTHESQVGYAIVTEHDNRTTGCQDICQCKQQYCFCLPEPAFWEQLKRLLFTLITGMG